MNTRAKLTGLFIFSMFLLFLAAGWAVFRFALPTPGTIRVGSVEDFQPGQAPRLFWQNSTPFYVVNTEAGLLVLSATSRRVKPCLIEWDAERNKFVDPCWGTRMSITGEYEFGPPWGMTPLLVSVIDGQVWVEVERK